MKATYRYLKKELGKALKIGFKVSADIPETYHPKFKKELPKQAEGFQPSFQTIQQEGREIKIVTGNFLVFEKTNEEWLKAFVPFDKKGWIEVIKNIPGRAWNVEGKFWSLPNVKESYKIQKRHVGMKYLTFTFAISPDIPERHTSQAKTYTEGRKHTSFLEKLSPKQKTAIIALEEKLTLERLSPSTIKSYKHHLAGLFFFYKNLPPEEITKAQLQQYLLHKIRFKKIAESTQNQIINGVKA